ncbi:MAG: hypothetical protein QG599_2623 [Pseudomonadota bacterium]|nr:hypothetical protein [Pseudomonadota bacterium]
MTRNDISLPRASVKAGRSGIRYCAAKPPLQIKDTQMLATKTKNHRSKGSCSQRPEIKFSAMMASSTPRMPISKP